MLTSGMPNQNLKKFKISTIHALPLEREAGIWAIPHAVGLCYFRAPKKSRERHSLLQPEPKKHSPGLPRQVCFAPFQPSPLPPPKVQNDAAFCCTTFPSKTACLLLMG